MFATDINELFIHLTAPVWTAGNTTCQNRPASGLEHTSDLHFQIAQAQRVIATVWWIQKLVPNLYYTMPADIVKLGICFI